MRESSGKKIRKQTIKDKGKNEATEKVTGTQNLLKGMILP